MADIQKLRELRLADPFHPFVIVLNTGERILVEKPYHFGMAPDGSRLGILGANGMRFLQPSSIEGAELATVAK